MGTQRASRGTTLERHLEAFRDLKANPGKYSQTEWCFRHHIGNRSATSALRMGIIERRDGMFYCTRERINADMVMQVLSWNAKQRHIEKGTYHDGLKSNDRTDEFYARLPDFFTTETASIVAKELGIPKTTMQRIFRKDARFHRMMHGKYCKAHVATSYTFTPSPISADDKKVLMTFLNKEEDSAPVPAITEPQKPIENTVTVNLPPRTVSILWGMIRFTL